MKNINWSSVKTNVIVFLLTAIVFTIVGWALNVNVQADAKESAAAMQPIVKSVEAKPEAASSK